MNTSDISTKIGCEQLIRDSIKLGPVGGIFNLAVVLKDNIFANQDAEKFAEVMAPKAVATKHFDELSRVLCPELQYFVVFSSVSCGRGNAGQSNYGMANSVMERIMEDRHCLGLPAKAIQWGAVGEVGLVADMLEDKLDMEIGGTMQQRISSCLEELDSLITINEPIVSSMVVAEKRQVSSSKGSILDSIMNILSIRDMKSLSMETSMSELGMDSLMAVEMQQTIEREYDIVISVQELRSLTLSQVVKYASKKDASDQSAPEISNRNVPSGVAMLLRNFGDETNSDKVILKLQSALQNDGVKALIVPGIEGMAGGAWYKIAESLECPAYVLQSLSTWGSSDLENICDAVIDDVLDLFANDDKFILIGHSFGSLLSIHLAKALESKGKSGRLILIDGSPKFLKNLTAGHMPKNYTDDNIHSMALGYSFFTVFPEESGGKLKDILSETSWESKVAKFIEVTKEKKLYSDGYAIKILNALVNRIKIALNADLDKFPKLLDTSISLVRPSDFSILETEDDYGLSSYCSKKIDISFIEGNHSTILDNPKLFELLNSYLK